VQITAVRRSINAVKSVHEMSVCVYIIIYINNSLHLYIYFIINLLFSALKVLYIWKREFPQPPPMFSIHLDDGSHSAPERPSHTRGDRVKQPIRLFKGMIRRP